MANYSALHYAEKAKKYAEYSQQYANDKINTTNITNCIIKIPQDVKVELKGGTLTLMAGSKVYIPNGSDNFDTVVTSKNLERTATVDGKYFLLYEQGNYLSFVNINTSITASSLPSNPTNQMGVYNTSENRIYKYSGGWSTAALESLPLCTFTVTNGVISSIDEIFNGFSYIGLTLFALPGIEGLTPSGRNPEGSSKNIICNTNRVLVRNCSNLNITDVNVYYNTNVLLVTNDFEYNNVQNIMMNKNTKETAIVCLAGNLDITGGKISKFNIKDVFKAVDFYDYNTLNNKLNNNYNTLNNKLNNNYNTLNNSINTLNGSFNLSDKENVKLSGEQTIPGNKTFTGNTTFNSLKINGEIIKKLNIDVSSIPDNSLYITPFSVSNSELSLYAYQQIAYRKNKILGNSYGLRRTVNGTNVFNGIEFNTDESGNTSATISNTPSLNSNDTSIATTAFVKSVLSSSGNGLASLISNANGNAIKFANGLTIQWGSYEQTGNNSVTFPTAFNSTNYTISICGLQDVTSSSTGANISDNAIRSKTTTGFISNHLNRNRTNMYLAIGY